jgi:D-lactate dehydrogenase (cytochrome)
VNTRPPSTAPAPAADSDATSFLEDAAHYPGGSATGVVRPRSIDEVSACLREARRILPVGAQSSLTGGATPFGDIVLSTERLNSITIDGDRVRVGAGVPLQIVQDELARTGQWFPPVPTYLGAFAGGAVATCAAGAATFKYGTVREWIDGLTVVLPGGDVLEVSRGECRAVDGRFTISTATGDRLVTLPRLKMPDVPKRSAGYFIAPDMDLVDLFVGSEGTLGVIVEAVFRTARLPAGLCRALVWVSSEDRAIALVGELRAAAIETWRTRDPLGIDVSAIEHIDQRSIVVLHEDGMFGRLHVTPAVGATVALLIDLELPDTRETTHGLWSQLESIRDAAAADSPLIRFGRMLDRHGVLEDAEIALPHDRARAAAFAALREAVPAGVKRRVAEAKRAHPSISKTAADMIVPFDRFGDMMLECRRLFDERHLDLAVWGHISDGNVHPNLIPHHADDVKEGRDAILELGAAVIEMGGCPLAEHGVGRSPIKQQLLTQLYGSAGVDAMRAVKLSLDPNGSLASGVIFPSQ